MSTPGRHCKLCSRPRARERTVEMRDDGASFEVIAAEIGIGGSSVHRCLSKHEAPALRVDYSDTQEKENQETNFQKKGGNVKSRYG